MFTPKNPYLITFIIYVTIIFIIGYFATRRTKNLSDYVLGGRSLSGPVTALGAGTSDMSSWLLMALPGAVYLAGLSYIWLPVGLILGAWANWYFVGQRLRVASEAANDALTIPSYLNGRFPDPSHVLRTVTAIVIIFFFTAYAVAGFISGAKLAEITFGWSYHQALLISSAVIVTYTCIGGFLAVSWIDFFQGILMFVALLTVPIVTYQNISWDTVSITLQHGPFSNVSLLSIVSLLAWGLGYFGQPHILVRFMAIRDPKEIPLAMKICMFWMIAALAGAVGTGLLGAQYFMHHPLVHPETVFLQLARILFNPWITGALFAAVLSAIMSTVSAQLLASSSSIIQDFYRAVWRKHASEREYLFLGRVIVFLVSSVSIFFAWNSNSNIMDVVRYAWSGLGASFGPVILISLYWKRMSKNAAVFGILSGAVTVVVWHLLSTVYHGIFDLNPILPGFMVNCVVIYCISVLQFYKIKQ